MTVSTAVKKTTTTWLS